MKLLKEAIRLEPRLVGAQLNLAEGLLLLTADLKKGDKAAAKALVEDSRRLSQVPSAWSIQFAELLAKQGLVGTGVEPLAAAIACAYDAVIGGRPPEPVNGMHG